MRLVLICCLLMTFLSLSAQTRGNGSSSGGFRSYTLKGAYMDTYLFRGHTFHNDPTYLGQLGIGMGKWSYDLVYAKPTDSNSALFEREINHQISYTILQGRRVTTVGYVAYEYEGVALEDTQEFFTRVSHLTKWKPTYGIAFDIDAYRGYFFDVSLQRDFPVSRTTFLTINAKLAGTYNMEEKTNDQGVVTEKAFSGDDGLTTGSVSVKFTWQPAKWVTLDSGFQYHHAFDELLYTAEGVEENTTIWRSSITLRFP